jgi:hypothetical protein
VGFAFTIEPVRPERLRLVESGLRPQTGR